MRCEIDARLDAIAAAMSACIDRGMAVGGILPGGLNVKRRAPALHALLIERAERALQDPLTVIDWVNLWALAVNEENAAGGKVVTAPTNGAAGIVPAVLRYYQRFTPQANDDGVRVFLLTAAAIARVPCSGQCLDLRRIGRLPGRGRWPARCPPPGSPPSWAERPTRSRRCRRIGMEHNLGLTFDPFVVWCSALHRAHAGRRGEAAIEASRLALIAGRRSTRQPRPVI